MVPVVSIAVFALVVFSIRAYGQFQGTKSLIIVDGKPVVCVQSEKDANEVLRRVKSTAKGNSSEIQFKQEVCVSRAPRDISPVSRHMAVRIIEHSVNLVAPHWAIIVNGRPVVALPTRKEAGEALDLAKLKFGKLVPNLAEEPQFKEKVTVDIAAVEVSIYRDTAQQAVDFLFSPTPAVTTDADYCVRKGCLAGTIAHRHGMKLAALKAFNPGVNLDRLQIDDKIRIKATDAGKPKLTVIRKRPERAN